MPRSHSVISRVRRAAVDAVVAAPLLSKLRVQSTAGLKAAAPRRHIDPHLARHPSNYGFSFSRPAPWQVRLRTALETHAPISARPLYRRLMSKVTRIPMAYYLEEPYFRGVFGGGPFEISPFVHVDRIRDPAILSRALTVELILTGRF